MRTNTRLFSILLTMLTALTLFMIPAVESAALQVGDIDGDAKVTAKDLGNFH